MITTHTDLETLAADVNGHADSLAKIRTAIARQTETTERNADALADAQAAHVAEATAATLAGIPSPKVPQSLRTLRDAAAIDGEVIASLREREAAARVAHDEAREAYDAARRAAIVAPIAAAQAEAWASYCDALEKLIAVGGGRLGRAAWMLLNVTGAKCRDPHESALAAAGLSPGPGGFPGDHAPSLPGESSLLRLGAEITARLCT